LFGLLFTLSLSKSIWVINTLNRTKDNNVNPDIRFELEDDQAIISMVQHGMGISIFPEMVLYRVPNSVRIINLEGDYYRSIGIAATSFKTISPAARKFIKIIQSYLNEPTRDITNSLHQ
jgi:DNA-binding transcriptional LysR family regulator